MINLETTSITKITFILLYLLSINLLLISFKKNADCVIFTEGLVSCAVIYGVFKKFYLKFCKVFNTKKF